MLLVEGRNKGQHEEYEEQDQGRKGEKPMAPNPLVRRFQRLFWFSIPSLLCSLLFLNAFDFAAKDSRWNEDEDDDHHDGRYHVFPGDADELLGGGLEQGHDKAANNGSIDVAQTDQHHDVPGEVKGLEPNAWDRPGTYRAAQHRPWLP